LSEIATDRFRRWPTIRLPELRCDASREGLEAEALPRARRDRDLMGM
jgi:hypothetical protein